MSRLLNKTLILIFLLISAICVAKEEVLFTVNNNPITTIDLTHRVNYLGLINNFDTNNIEKNKYLDDLVSVILFHEFSIQKRLNIKQQKIDRYFDKLFTNNQVILDELIKKNELTKEIILKNIRYDLQRKTIIEFLLNDRIDKINLTNTNYNIIDIYNIKLNYFIIAKKYSDQIINIDQKLLKKEISFLKDYLNKLDIEYDYFSKEIINLDRINNKIKEIILSNENTFFIDESNYYITGIVEKKLKKDIDLKYSFFQIKTKENVDFDILVNDLINCNNIESKKSDKRLEINEFISVDFDDLNLNIFQKFSKENEKLIIKNNDQQFLILLCNIDYNKKIANDKSIDFKIQQIASEIEIEFVQAKKKEFKFQIFN